MATNPAFSMHTAELAVFFKKPHQKKSKEMKGFGLLTATNMP